jgi:hypothetical protein
MTPSSIFATEGGGARVKLLRALEETHDLAVQGIGGHPVPGFRHEHRRAGGDERMQPGCYILEHLF